jgi:prepilin-type N-terminal cleavage/methylation domain-containing protein
MTKTKANRIGSLRGFTLVEMLVVVFIGVVIFTLVASAMIGSSKISRKHMNRAARSMTARIILEQMTRDIESAFAWRDPQGGGVVFQGVDRELQGPADLLTLVRPRLEAPVPNELEKVTYEVKQFDSADGPRQLLVTSRQALKSGEAAGSEKKLGLPDQGTQIKLDLQYRGGAGEWQPSWDGASQGLPSAVRIQLEADDTRVEGPVRFETVVRIHSETIGGATP